LNRELEASLEAARLDANALQQENQRIKETCSRNALAANFFHLKAVHSDAVYQGNFQQKLGQVWAMPRLHLPMWINVNRNASQLQEVTNHKTSPKNRQHGYSLANEAYPASGA
jgi:hypothetical protein